MSKYNVLIIDPQVDFHEGGNLAVSGADADNKRISEMLFQSFNNSKINSVFVSLDTHTDNHIGHQGYWKIVGRSGEKLPFFSIFYVRDSKIYTKINDEEVEVEPVHADRKLWTIKYVENVASFGKGPALIWPTHCIEDSEGHKVKEPLRTVLRNNGSLVKYHVKGQNELAEMYSIFKAEIPVPENTGMQMYSGKYTEKSKPYSLVDGYDDTTPLDHLYLNTAFNTAIDRGTGRDTVYGGLYSHLTRDKLPIYIYVDRH
jgi:nicotinamidase-related amidase